MAGLLHLDHRLEMLAERIDDTADEVDFQGVEEPSRAERHQDGQMGAAQRSRSSRVPIDSALRASGEVVMLAL
ncbi:hypothetical protein [Microbispora triticiradicis]|uniref:Uncharacterized protein n=2 Tax=Microbispora TaxID=2005 RepID=A0ABY3LNM6_9ACTN|nr:MULTISPECIES: hypothetical protein [Microbispora]TLP54848.1 hypothetical protein FED44_27290 [Microbispora fusca]TYB43159.1 hypothetical protein FXF59_34020 [Microbispora tritici]